MAKYRYLKDKYAMLGQMEYEYLLPLSQRCTTKRFDLKMPMIGHLVAKWALQGFFLVH